MSTRSRIGRVREDGTVVSIYCHSDSYVSYNGALLFEQYQDVQKIDQLIALGDISSLGEEIGEKWNFDEYPRLPEHENWTRAYGRDRGEEGVDAFIQASVQEFWDMWRDDVDIEFAYLYDNGTWYVGYGYPSSQYRIMTLVDVIEQMNAELQQEEQTCPTCGRVIG